MTASTAPPRASALSTYPWLLVGLLWICAFLNSSDRSLLVGVMPAIRDEFGLTNTQLALPTTIFFWVYAAAVFLTSRFGDKMRRGQVIIAGLIFWSVATGFVSLSTGFAMLIGARAFVAIGEATYYPSATALISDWHPNKTRGRALSLHQTGVFAGALVGSLIAGFIGDHLGWRAPFLIFGVAGVAFSLLLFKYLRDAPHRDAERAEKHDEPLGMVLRIKPAVMLCGVFFLATAASNGLTIWAPTFVHDKFATDLTRSALTGAVPINLAGMLSVPLGGLLADWLAARSTIGRFHALTIGLAAAGVLLAPLALADSVWTVGLVLLTSSIGKGLFDGCIYAAMHDVVPARARSTAVGIMTMSGFIGAGLAPLFVAKAGEILGMAMAIASLAALYFVAVAILLVSSKTTREAILPHDPVGAVS
ncbi:MFS transporter [Caulobacter sp. 1776]|uniref:MFS transporter n=1 Tax=Caulobacter sp. 1776 TaxID=3156420 RepID=UPI003393F721